MKNLLNIFLVIIFCVPVVSVNADDIAPENRDEGMDTALIKKLPHKHEKKDFLQFQAEERKVYFDDLAEEKQRFEQEWSAKSTELLKGQRQARHEFEPEKHSLEERRVFFVTQRDEMLAFRKERKFSTEKFNSEQKIKRDEFHLRQVADRRDMNLRLKAH